MAADAQKVIELVFSGIDKTGEATKSALGNLGDFAGKVQGATQPIADLTGAALKLETAILAAGTAMVALSLNAASDFDANFRQISTLFTATTADLNGFKESILTYASSSGKSLQDITDSISAAVGSGVKWSDSLSLISTAERLAVATRADLKGTTEALVSTMNAYGMSQESAGLLADLFFQIIADGKIEMNQLGQNLANLTPISAAAGVSMTEIGAAIATLTAGGMQPSTAIDALKSAIGNIIDPTSKASKLAADLGIEFSATALKSKGLEAVLQDVGRATGGSSEKISVLFGDVTGLTAVLALTGPQAAAFSQSIDNMGNSAGAVATAFQKMTDSVDESTAKISSALTALMVRIGTPLLDEFGDISKAIVAIFNALGASVKDGKLGGLVQYVEGLMGELKSTLETVAKNLPAALESADFSGFKRAIDLVVASIKNLFSGVDLSTPEGLKRAIELVGTAFLGLSSYVSGVIDSFKPLFDILVKASDSLEGLDVNAIKAAGNLGGFLTQLNAVAGGVASLLSYLEVLVGILVARQGLSLVGGIAAAAGAIPALTAALGTALTASAAMAGTALTATAGALAGPAGLTLAAGAAGYGVGTVLNDGINKVVSTLTGSETTLGSWIYDLTHGGEAAEDMGTSTVSAADGVQKLTDAADGSAEAIAQTAQGADEAAKATEALGDGAKQSSLIIDEATGKVTGYTGAFNNLSEADKKALGLQKDFGQSAQVAGQAALGAADGLDRAAAATQNWALEMAKLDSAERIAAIESTTKIAVANIEADIRQLELAFESMDNTITSTGETLVGLAGGFAGLNLEGLSADNAATFLMGAMREESMRRDRALELQGMLITAQIKHLEAQTDAINRDQPLITVSGDNLAPHLEAIMWEVLQSIQVRVNQDGLQMLLEAGGMGTGAPTPVPA